MKRFLFFFLILIFVVSCSLSPFEPEDDSSENKEDVSQVYDIQFSVEQPSFYGSKGMNPDFTISLDVNERLSVMSDVCGKLDATITTSTDNGGTATFGGNGFSMKNGSTYYALYPGLESSAFNGVKTDTRYTSTIPYNYVGQTQNGNSNAHLSKYLTAWASGTVADGNVSFNFQPKASYIKMNFTLPTGAGTVKEILLTTAEKNLVVGGTFTIDNNNGTVTATGEPERVYSSALRMKVNDVSDNIYYQAIGGNSLSSEPRTLTFNVVTTDGIYKASPTISAATEDNYCYKITGSSDKFTKVDRESGMGTALVPSVSVISNSNTNGVGIFSPADDYRNCSVYCRVRNASEDIYEYKSGDYSYYDAMDTGLYASYNDAYDLIPVQDGQRIKFTVPVTDNTSAKLVLYEGEGGGYKALCDKDSWTTLSDGNEFLYANTTGSTKFVALILKNTASEYTPPSIAYGGSGLSFGINTDDKFTISGHDVTYKHGESRKVVILTTADQILTQSGEGDTVKLIGAKALFTKESFWGQTTPRIDVEYIYYDPDYNPTGSETRWDATSNNAGIYAYLNGTTLTFKCDISDIKFTGSLKKMFTGCMYLKNLNVSGWDTSCVTDMSYMFYSLSNSYLESIDLSTLDTSGVTNMSYMFALCSVPSINVSNFDTSNVTDMSDMFWVISSDITTLDLSCFDTSNVTNMCAMFGLNTHLKTIIVSEDKWNTENVTDSSYMFSYCTAIVGGKGTTFDENHIDKEYARIDGGSTSATPGYLTDADACYLTFSSTSPFAIASYNGDSGTTVAKYWDGSIYYSTDARNWSEWDGNPISSGADDRLYFRGTGNTRVSHNDSYDCARWNITGSNVNCEGNIETLLDYNTVLNGEHPAMNSWCFSYMFDGCTSLVTAPALPATTLANDCYVYMFRGCTSLVEAPALPATTLASRCYMGMFFGCTSLVTAPALPTTTLANSCYSQMFYGCTSLENAPVLPATTLAYNCYQYMFQGCTSLVEAPALPSTTLASYCYDGMFRYCINLENAPALPATTMADFCYSEMFNGCTSLENAPVLPATTLADNCYIYLFNGCTSLVTAPTLPATTLASSCYMGMFEGCTSLVTAPTLPATTLASYCYDCMFYGCTSLKISNSTGTMFLQYPDGYTPSSYAGNMFTNTGGDFIGTPVSGETYYYEPTGYLTFSSSSPFTIASYNEETETTVKKYWNGTMYYSTDANTWTVWDGNPVSSGSSNRLYFRGTGNTRVSGAHNGGVYGASFARWHISGGTVSCSGNIETLLDYSVVLNGNHPTMDSYCYEHMFYGCTSLVTAPEMPATTVGYRCCHYMFCGCTSLVNAPELPATEVSTDSYGHMFCGCTSLVNSPSVLPALTLHCSSYEGMFANCTSLVNAPELPATELDTACYASMFAGCSSLRISNNMGTMFFQCPSNIGDKASGMFKETGGTYTSAPVAGGTYYYY